MPSLLDLMGYGLPPAGPGGGPPSPQGASMPIPSFALGGMNMGGLPQGGLGGMPGLGMGRMGMDLMAGRNPGTMALQQPGRYAPQRRRAQPQGPWWGMDGPSQGGDPRLGTDPYAQPRPWWQQGGLPPDPVEGRLSAPTGGR